MQKTVAKGKKAIGKGYRMKKVKRIKRAHRKKLRASRR